MVKFQFIHSISKEILDADVNIVSYCRNDLVTIAENVMSSLSEQLSKIKRSSIIVHVDPVDNVSSFMFEPPLHRFSSSNPLSDCEPLQRTPPVRPSEDSQGTEDNKDEDNVVHHDSQATSDESAEMNKGQTSDAVEEANVDEMGNDTPSVPEQTSKCETRSMKKAKKRSAGDVLGRSNLFILLCIYIF